MTNFTEIKMHHATRAKATKLAEVLEAEYPRVGLLAATEECDHAEFPERLVGWTVTFDDDEVEGFIETKDLSLASVLELVQDAGHDPEEPAEGEAEEEEDRGDVVKPTYKAFYKEVSDTGRCNGDWLAEFLNNQCLNSEDKIDVDRFNSVLVRNNITVSDKKWGAAYYDESRRNRGWQGRFRMSGRVVLEKVAAVRGVVFTAEGEEVPVPEGFLAVIRRKHAKAVAKAQKAEEGKGA